MDINKNENILFSDKMDMILKFIKNSNKEKIKDELIKLIEYDEFCPVLLGEGIFGKVYIPGSNKTILFKLNNIVLELPIVIKESHKQREYEIDLQLDIFENKLYISSGGSIITEMLILMFIKKLWYKTVHLPLILGYTNCSNKNLVDKIITFKYGLDKDIIIDLTNKVWQNYISDKAFPKLFKSSIATIFDLFQYIRFSKNKDNSIIFPNGIKCNNISKLYDYICISYLVTHYLLTKNNIFPYDLHESNIFIHWLNNNSYYNNENIKNIKYIIYKIGNKYYKIKTFGFIIIIGDTGLFNMIIKEDVILMGRAMNIK